jgi:small GTP-binding protein
MIGDFAVGKTSLVRRFVSSIFTDKYLTTVGVKIDTKTVSVANGDSLKMILWDIAGEPTMNTLTKSYIRGAAGFILVADGTRRSTFHNALELKAQTEATLGTVPCVFVLNKRDLNDEWSLTDEDRERVTKLSTAVVETSAKTGDGVPDAFSALAEAVARV